MTLQHGIGDHDDLFVRLRRERQLGGDPHYYAQLHRGGYFHGALDARGWLPEQYLFGEVPREDTLLAVASTVNAPVRVSLSAVPDLRTPTAVTTDVLLLQVAQIRQLELLAASRDPDGVLGVRLAYTSFGAPSVQRVVNVTRNAVVDRPVYADGRLALPEDAVVPGEEVLVTYYAGNSYSIESDVLAIFFADPDTLHDLDVTYQVETGVWREIPYDLHPLASGCEGGFLYLDRKAQEVGAITFETGPFGGILRRDTQSASYTGLHLQVTVLDADDNPLHALPTRWKWTISPAKDGVPTSGYFTEDDDALTGRAMARCTAQTDLQGRSGLFMSSAFLAAVLPDNPATPADITVELCAEDGDAYAPGGVTASIQLPRTAVGTRSSDYLHLVTAPTYKDGLGQHYCAAVWREDNTGVRLQLGGVINLLAIVQTHNGSEERVLSSVPCSADGDTDTYLVRYSTFPYHLLVRDLVLDTDGFLIAEHDTGSVLRSPQIALEL